MFTPQFGGGQQANPYQIQTPSWQNTGTTLADVYKNKLGRDFDQSGYDFWQGRMNGVGGDALTLDQVRQKIASSSEGQAYQSQNPAYNTFDFARDTMSDAAAMMAQASATPPPQVTAAPMAPAPQVNAQPMQNAPNVNAQNINAGQLSNTDLSPYMNPFTQAVTDTTMSELERQRLIAMNQTNSAASGAFGGSRHGIMQAETNRGFGDIAARTAAGLNSDNFMQAQGAAFQDIGNSFAANQSNQASSLQAQLANANNAMQVGRNNQASDLQAQLANAGNSLDVGRSNQASNLQAQLANASNALSASNSALQGANSLAQLSNMGFSRGQSALNSQMTAGNMQQALQQQLINAGKQQTNDDTGFTDEALSRLLAGMGGAQYGKSTTDSKTPSWGGLLTALL